MNPTEYDLDAIARRTSGWYVRRDGPLALGDGIYVTRGLRLKPGQSLTGNGRTIVKRADNSVVAGTHNVVVDTAPYANADGCVVSGITFDCNQQNQPPNAGGAVYLRGNDVRIENCRAINWGASINGYEAFIFAIGHHQSVGTINSGAVIRNCRVDSPAGAAGDSGVSAFCIFGLQDIPTTAAGYTVQNGWIRGALIEGCEARNIISGTTPGTVHGFRGFSFGCVTGGRITGCRMVNVTDPEQNSAKAWTDGIYFDTTTIRDCVFDSNIFHGPARGICLRTLGAQYAISGLTIRDNDISAWRACLSIVKEQPGSEVDRLLIQNNRLRNWGGSAETAAMALYGATNTLVRDNTISCDGWGRYDVRDCAPTFVGNLTLAGADANYNPA